MEKIKKLGKIIWGITYITGGLLSTIINNAFSNRNFVI